MALQCPRCRSKKVGMFYPNLQCFRCGQSEPLIDFAISFDQHRRLSVEFGQPDPGPCKPPGHTFDELNERLTALEETEKSGPDQLSEKVRPRVDGRPYEKPRPQLARGVRL